MRVDIFKSEVLAWIVAIFVFSSWVQARSIRFNLSVEAAPAVDIFKSEAFSPLCHLFGLIKGTCLQSIAMWDNIQFVSFEDYINSTIKKSRILDEKHQHLSHCTVAKGTGIGKTWYRKKYRYRYRKYLVPEKVSVSLNILGTVTHCSR